MKNSVNILIDANNFWNRTLFSANFKKKDSKLFDPEEEGMYMRKLATDLAAFLRRFKGNYSSVIFCIDSRSWRKTEVELADLDYKGNRKKREEINWDAYNRINDEFVALIQAAGVTIAKADNCEADDLIRGYVEYFKSIGENSVVWSADNDLFQLIYFNDESFNIQYYQPPMQKNSIAASAEFFEWLNGTADGLDAAVSAEDMLFNLAEMSQNSYNTTLKSIFDKAGLKTKVIDPKEVVFKKIIGGDSSDGISKIKAGIGKKTLDALWVNHFQNTFTVDQALTEVYQLSIITTLQNEKKLKTQEEVDSAIKQLGFNVTLIILDERTSPDYVNSNIQSVIDSSSFPKIDTNQMEDMKILLKGTEFFDSSKVNGYVPKGMDPFAGIDTGKTVKTKKLF